MQAQPEDRRTEEHLKAAAQQRRFPQVLEFVQGKFQSQREHEQDDAYFRESLDADVGIGNVVQNAAVGQNDAADEVARHQGLPEMGQNQGDRDDSHEHDGQQREKGWGGIRFRGSQHRKEHHGRTEKGLKEW